MPPDTMRERAASRLAAPVAAVRRRVRLSDAVAVLVLLMATVHLVAHDGGRAAGDMLWVLVVGAVGTLVLIGTLRRTSHVVVWLLAVWAFAPLIALLDAEIRAGAVRPLTGAALAPAAALATIHLWRRPWGPATLGSILALAAGRSWYLTFLGWWGSAGGRPTWMALSWHNQSGTLMGVLGVAATATAAVLGTHTAVKGDAGRIGLPVHAATLVAGGLAGATLAGAWLSGSRGAVIATGIGLVAVVVGLLRRGALQRAAPALAGVVLATTIAVIGLEAMVESDAGQPLAVRDQAAGQNLSERFGYWQAVVGMVSSRPLTGWGPGSYRWASVPHYPDDTGLTSSAHNEYIEVLGEAGLVGAAPVWFATLAIATLAGAAILRGPQRSGPDGPRAGALAAAGAVVVLGVHAGLDFDWDYPVLLALFAMGGAVLWAERSGPGSGAVTDAEPSASPSTGPVPTLAATAGMLLLLGVAIAAAALTARGDTRWDLNRQLGGAMAAAHAGDIPTARAHIETARRWNPGAPALPVLVAVVEHHANTITDADLAATVGPRTASHGEQLLVANRLFATGNAAAARAITDGLAPVLEARRRWGVRDGAIEVAALRLRTEAALAGCDAAAALADPVRRWLASFDVPAASVENLLTSIANDTGCRMSEGARSN